jgi:hypothetical protein
MEDELADSVGKLSAFLCTEEFLDSRSTSTIIVYFSGLIGFSSDGTTFERPRNYTSKLSALIYCIRLCLLEATLPRFAHPSIGWEARPAKGSLKRLNKIHPNFLCHGCQAPMGELLSLRSYGQAIAHSDGPSFRVEWSEDSETVAWDTGKGIGHLTMQQLRQLGDDSVYSAKASMARLLYGLSPSFELNSVRDRLSNHDQGYSFVQDPANKLNSAYLDLLSRACLDSIDGLVVNGNWNMVAVLRYLKEEENFLSQLMLSMYLRAGQAPRSSELFSVEHQNGSSTSRGICVYGGTIVYITRHSKARHSTNQEFYVARYLPSLDSQLLATYLVYVRPFTDMLCRKCLGHRQERRLLFASFEKPTSPWKVGVLTKALKKLTQDICGVPIGVRVYRQLSIAVTEKHVKQISNPFNRYDDKTAMADLEVVFAWQSGHRPIQRGTTYGIDGAYPDSLQPALLRVYEWASGMWQRFLKAASPLSSRMLAGPMICEELSSSPESGPYGGIPSRERAFRGKTEDGFGWRQWIRQQ